MVGVMTRKRGKKGRNRAKGDVACSERGSENLGSAKHHTKSAVLRGQYQGLERNVC